MILHVSRRRLGAEKTALQVRVDDEIPLLLGHVEQTLPRLNTSVVDVDVQPAETLGHCREHLSHARRNADISLDGKRVSTRRLKLRDCRVGQRRVEVVVDGNAASGPSELESNAFADPAIGAGDEGGVSVEID